MHTCPVVEPWCYWEGNEVKGVFDRERFILECEKKKKIGVCLLL